MQMKIREAVKKFGTSYVQVNLQALQKLKDASKGTLINIDATQSANEQASPFFVQTLGTAYKGDLKLLSGMEVAIPQRHSKKSYEALVRTLSDTGTSSVLDRLENTIQLPDDMLETGQDFVAVNSNLKDDMLRPATVKHVFFRVTDSFYEDGITTLEPIYSALFHKTGTSSLHADNLMRVAPNNAGTLAGFSLKSDKLIFEHVCTDEQTLNRVVSTIKGDFALSQAEKTAAYNSRLDTYVQVIGEAVNLKDGPK